MKRIRKLLQLISKFSKGAGKKRNIQKSFIFAYTNNDIAKREIKKAIPFIIATKIIKHIGIHLTKEVKNIYKN